MNIYPRETVEFQPVTVTVDGATVTAGVKFAIAQEGIRPAAWAAPTVLGEQIGVMVSGLVVGYYQVWAQVTTVSEVAVIECGTFQVT